MQRADKISLWDVICLCIATHANTYKTRARIYVVLMRRNICHAVTTWTTHNAPAQARCRSHAEMCKIQTCELLLRCRSLRSSGAVLRCAKMCRIWIFEWLLDHATQRVATTYSCSNRCTHATLSSPHIRYVYILYNPICASSFPCDTRAHARCSMATHARASRELFIAIDARAMRACVCTVFMHREFTGSTFTGVEENAICLPCVCVCVVSV